MAEEVTDIYETAGVASGEITWAHRNELKALGEACYKDQKWQNAQAHLRSRNLLRGVDDARALLLEGARAFGIWQVSNKSLRALIHHILNQESPGPSPGLLDWVRRQEAQRPAEEYEEDDPETPLDLEDDEDDEESEPQVDYRYLVKMQSGRGSDPAQKHGEEDEEAHDTDGVREWASFVRQGVIFWFKRIFLLALLVTCCLYGYWVVAVKYVFEDQGETKNLAKIFGPLVFTARASGLAAAIFTACLYSTMCRSCFKPFYVWFSEGDVLLALMDGHKDLHIWFGKSLLIAAAIHVLSHLVATVPGWSDSTPEQLNSILGCANRGNLTIFPGNDLFWFLQNPACPIEEHIDGWTLVFTSTPGVSGLALVIVLLVIGYTGRKSGRKWHFDLFWYMHNIAIIVWPLLLIIHGSNQWIGVGFPLTILIAGVPILVYYFERILRLIRYYLFAGTYVRIQKAVILLGEGGSPKNGLTALEVSKPPCLWSYRPGMYAFICMPEYAPLQWHPFTISSGPADKNVHFVIQGVGDWTQELLKRCLAAKEEDDELPILALDGPYPAPTQSALSREVLISVGAGVGITPFFSLMATVISYFEDEQLSKGIRLKEAHFFWMARSCDEFLFGKRLFSRIANCPRMRNKIFIHLHCTAKLVDQSCDAAAYLFRTALARQSAVDKKEFEKAFHSECTFAGPSLPWVWANHAKGDVLWLSDLTNAPSGDEPDDDEADEEEEASKDTSEEKVSVLCPGMFQTTQFPESGYQMMFPGPMMPSPPPRSPSDDPEILMPVVFGRPDFEKEIKAIGNHYHHLYNVHVYVCAQDAVVKACKDACEKAREEAFLRQYRVQGIMSQATSLQEFRLTYERFG